MSFEVICLIYVAGLAIVFAELFVPGGILGFVGSAVIVTSIVFAFTEQENPIYGVSLIIISFIFIPVMVVWSLRRVSLDSAQTVEGYVSTEEGIDQLLGEEGVTATMLRPSGAAKISNRRVDVVAENAVVIEKDVPIKVVKVEGNQVIVRPISKTE